MAQNYAKKYSTDVVERYQRKSITQVAFDNNGYNWDGVKTISVTTVDVPTMNPYDRTATSNRFGTPTEVDTSGQDLTVAQDWGREQVVDFGNMAETQNAVKAGEHLKRVTDYVIKPSVDIYRLSVLGTAITANSLLVDTGATTKDNAYNIFLNANQKVSDSFAPEEGRVAFVTGQFYNYLKLSGYTTDSDAGQAIKRSGVIAEVDGVKIVKVPTSWMPTNFDLMVVHPSAVVGPIKLENYRNLGPQQGYDGNILQWRVLYDAFVITTLKDAMAGHKVTA